MRGDSICPGNANSKIDLEHQVYAVGQECIVYALYIIQNTDYTGRASSSKKEAWT